MDYRNLGWLLLIAVVLIAILAVVTPVIAISTDTTPAPEPIFIKANESTTTELLNHTYEIHRIQQGDKVYLGDHIDISGVVAGNKALVWFRGGDPDPAEQPYVIPLPDTKAGYFNFYVDPAIFSQMTGYIYKWNGYFEPSGNTHAFYIIARYRNATLTYPNGTMIETSNPTSGVYNVTPEPEEPILPAKHIADYLTVHGQNITIQTNGKSKMWVLGRIDGIYDQMSAENQTLNKFQIEGLEAGKYQLLIQYPSKGGFEVFYKPETQELFTRNADQPPWVVNDPISLTSLAPVVTADTIKSVISSTNDTYDIQSLSVQNPEIQLVSMDETYTRTAKEYYDNSNLRGDVTVFDVRGYTNVLPGTNLYFALDERNQNKIKWFNTTAEGEFPGDMRMFKVLIPVYWDEMKEGMHTISGYTDVGGSIYRDFPVRTSPDHSFIPNQSVKWIDNRSPWVPTPTPITVTQVVTRVVTQIVTIPVTPSNEQVYAQQKAAQDKVNSENWGKVATFGGMGLVVVGCIGAGWYGLSVYRRAKK